LCGNDQLFRHHSARFHRCPRSSRAKSHEP
jgi:hypothetical protein